MLHEARDLVDEPAVGQDVDGVLLAVGVQVAHDEHVRVARRGLDLLDEVEQARGLVDARLVVAALAVALVCVGADVAGRAALRGEVVDDESELLAVGDRLEGLRERVARADPGVVAVGVHVVDRRPHGRDARGLVDDDVLDQVRAGVRADEEGVSAGRGRGVHAVDQVLHGAGGPAAVVLHLDDAEHVRVNRRQRGDDLGALALELRQVVRAARGREAAGPAVEPRAVAVEVVQDVGSWRP